MRAIPILMYHQILADPLPVFRKYTVTPGAFATQMGWLARAGYTAINLDCLLAARRGESKLPLRPVVVTFDDGFQASVDHAVPILQRHSFTAVFYLVAGLMGQNSHWLRAERGITFPLVDWATARQLQAMGFVCGAHTLTHPRLTEISAADCRSELATARLTMEQQLGRPIQHLAYPFGAYDETVRGIASDVGYRSACSVRIGLSNADDDLLALHRVPITGQDSLVDFIARVSTGRTAGELMRDGRHRVAATWRAARRR